LELLDPEAVLRPDNAAIKAGKGKWAEGALIRPEVRGARAAVQALSRRAQGVQLALVGGSVGAAWSPGGRPRAAFAFRIANGKVTEIKVIVDPIHLRELEITMLGD
jgi:RNA polymerase sigma-70 factor (ECF subfamily)